MAEEDHNEVAKANDVFTISLVRKEKSGEGCEGIETVSSFRPTWTYPIFGDEEEIYGYKTPQLRLQYNASDMRPHFTFRSHQHAPAGSRGRTDIMEAVKPFLPQVAFGKGADFKASVINSSDDWTPPGTLIETSQGADGIYEIWKGSLEDQAVLQLVRRVQILVSLFIEGGSPIRTESSDECDADPLDRWTVFFLYQKRPLQHSPDKFSYVFAGYSTVYRLFILQPPTAPISPTSNFELPEGTMSFSDFPCRSRISQFIILPPFHKKGNGMRLYNQIYKNLLHDKMTFEITVEDPNEAFDVMRDMADMSFLREQLDFTTLVRINTSIEIKRGGTLPQIVCDKKALEELRLKYKIAPRQFNRLVEIHTFFRLPDSVRPSLGVEEAGSTYKKKATPSEEHEYRLWKLLTKSRIYAQNSQVMSQLDPDERIQKLNETLVAVELEYAFLLVRYMARKVAQQELNEKKRKADGNQEAGKKPRVEEA